MEDERDIVVFTDEENNEVQLEVIDYFFHNGEEYAVMIDADEEVHNHEDCCGCGHEHEHEQELYIMKVVINGDMEEFIPIEEDQADELIAIVEKRFNEEFDEDDFDEDEDEE